MVIYEASAAPAVGAPTTSLTTSANSSGTAYAKFHNHTQGLQGMWKRVWVYDNNPTGVPPSGCPVVLYTYLDINVKEVVIEEFESASYASGTFQQAQDIDYWSDSSLGGWGVSGQFWSAKNGIIRSLVSGTGYTEDTCETSWNVAAAKMPGDYDASYDTSANFNPQFFADVVSKAKQQCTRFNTGIVTI
jgi:hypothetical protein